MIHRRFIAVIAAASIAVTGLSAVPVRADTEKTAKIVAGVAALAIIGAAIAESKKKRRQNEVSQADYYDYGYDRGYPGSEGNVYRNYDDRVYRRDDHRYDNNSYDNGRFDNHNRTLPRRVQRKLLPKSCRIQARTRRGRVPAYGANCLSNKFQYAHALPNRCAFKAKTRRGGKRRTVFSKKCLSNHGYRPGNY